MNDGSSRTLFTPLSPVETPNAMQELCDTFNNAISRDEIDPLLLIINFIKDFLCIHPFNDGNGRMSRLLTTLLLYRSGFVVCKYISLEKKIEKTKDTYYDVLEESSENWNEGKNDNTPFVKYLLGIILSACHDFEECPSLVRQTIEKALKQLCDCGKIKKKGSGSGTFYVRCE